MNVSLHLCWVELRLENIQMKVYSLAFKSDMCSNLGSILTAGSASAGASLSQSPGFLSVKWDYKDGIKIYQLCKQWSTASPRLEALISGVMKHGSRFLCFLCMRFLPVETGAGWGGGWSS